MFQATSSLKILSPTGILGYGFPPESLERARSLPLDAIAVDAGSTDAGAAYLGFEPELSSEKGAFLDFVKRDLEPLLLLALEKEIPLIIGSAGFAGGNLHLAGVAGIVQQIAAEHRLSFKMAVIQAEVAKNTVTTAIENGQITSLGSSPPLTTDDVDSSVRLVAQMGTEPFVDALRQNAQVILAGRANDPSMFAALPIFHGFDKGLALHMGKILECGAIAAEPGSGSDMLVGTLFHDHFELEPVNLSRACTPLSVAAHSLYEKADPNRLFAPGGHVDLTASEFTATSSRSVRVSGSRWISEATCKVKVEGARRVGFRCINVCGISDPFVMGALDSLIDGVRHDMGHHFSEIEPERWQLIFHHYGAPEAGSSTKGYPMGLVIEVVAETQALATSMAGHARSLLFHRGFKGRISTAGNLAFPFSPLDISAGPVYEFSVYHLIEVPDPSSLFPVVSFPVGGLE